MVGSRVLDRYDDNFILRLYTAYMLPEEASRGLMLMSLYA